MSILLANRFKIDNEVKDLLGRGGMGEVYRASDTQTGDLVAIKALNPEILARNADLLERFQREGDILGQLNHPNIVRFITSIQEGSRHYLVMEYIPGGSLETLLCREGKLSPVRTVEIALEIADALTRAHHLGILHRDIKPANVLLAVDGTPRLADFGIAYLESSQRLTQTGVLVGTVDYLSPELFKGEAPEACNDIWSFGVLLFQMITGRLPFTGKNLSEMITAILTQPVPDLAALAPGTPDALSDLVYRMLEKDPQRRIPSVRLVGAELEAIQKGHAAAVAIAGSEARAGTHPETRFAPSIPTVLNARSNLPIQATPFIGRQVELAELLRLLSEPAVRLVTIVGLGGMGKTRLALEAGSAQVELTHGMVFFVPLASLQSADAIISAMAEVLNFTFSTGNEPRRQLIDFLAQKEMLLILDNCEHLLASDGETSLLISDILGEAEKVKILTTSRLRIGIEGETIFPLGGMVSGSEDAVKATLQSSAGQLFLQGARRVQPGFEPAESDLQPIAEICRMVQGMPLAILLAAAWVEMLSPAEIAAEMKTNLDLLQTQRQVASARQRSVRAVFDYSWNFLSEREQRILAILSVFRGGFTRQAAQDVAGASLRELMSLSNRSLLQRTPVGRYEIHELLRQYAAEKLHADPIGEETASNRHAAYYADFLKIRAVQLHTRSQKQAMVEIGAELDNLRLGWDRSIARRDIDAIDSSLDSLSEFYRMRGLLREGHDAFARAANMLAVACGAGGNRQASLALARAQMQVGLFSEHLGDNVEAERLFHASLDTARALDARREVALALSYLGGSASLYGGEQGSLCEEALDLFQELGDRSGIAVTLRGLGWAALHAGNYPLARDRFQQSVDAFRTLGDVQELTESLGGRGYVAWIMGEYELGKRTHDEMLSLSQENGDRKGMARALADLGIDACGLKQYEESLRLFHESLDLYTEIGDRLGIADELGDIGELCNQLGRYAEAFDYATRSITFQTKRSHGLGDWELRVLGVANLGLGNYQEAARNFSESLQNGLSTAKPGRVLFTIASIANYFATRGQEEQAFELLAIVFHDPRTWQWAKDTSAELYAQLRAILPINVVVSAEERARTRTVEATAIELVGKLLY